MKCQDCGTEWASDDEKCPNCGSSNKRLVKIENELVNIEENKQATNITKMDAQAWTIFGVFIALLAPPIVYYVFSILDYRFGYKILIWLAFVLFCACLIRSFTVIRFLHYIGEKAYGKRIVT